MCDFDIDMFEDITVTLTKYRITMDEAKKLIEEFSQLGYEFSHFEGGSLVFVKRDQR